jgi:hypothetical protein
VPGVGYVPGDGAGDTVAPWAGYVPGYDYGRGYGYPMGNQNSFQEQRIVYVPYAMPPPITVERIARSLPRPPTVRQLLGDARMYEYPQKPQQMYQTRSPRDPLASNPPFIGY